MVCRYCDPHNFKITKTFANDDRFVAMNYQNRVTKNEDDYAMDNFISCRQYSFDKTDHYYFDNDYDYKEINFCPFCGEEFKLTDRR